MNTYRVTFISHVTTGVTYRQGVTLNVLRTFTESDVRAFAPEVLLARNPECRVGTWEIESIRAI